MRMDRLEEIKKTAQDSYLSSGSIVKKDIFWLIEAVEALRELQKLNGKYATSDSLMKYDDLYDKAIERGFLNDDG